MPTGTGIEFFSMIEIKIVGKALKIKPISPFRPQPEELTAQLIFDKPPPLKYNMPISTTVDSRPKGYPLINRFQPAQTNFAF
jgi:hypothetical protein